MRLIKYVDAFSDRQFKGNPVAVILDAEGLSGDEMQTIARWTNLSETTFVLPATDPKADYTLRIFTPKSELSFAGHPTLGSAHAILESRKFSPSNGQMIQQCKQGLVNITVDSELESRTLALELPAAQVTDLRREDLAELEDIIGTPVDASVLPAFIDVGPVWIVAKVSDVETLLNIRPNFARLSALTCRLGATGLTSFANYTEIETSDIEVRSFAPSCGIEEDPVCGSGNGSVAVFRKVRALLSAGDSSYVATQGRKVGRDGRVYVSVSPSGAVQVGGQCVTVVDGTLNI